MKKAPKGIKRKKYFTGTDPDGVQQLDASGQPILSGNNTLNPYGTEFKTTGNYTDNTGVSNIPKTQELGTNGQSKKKGGFNLGASMGWMQFANQGKDFAKGQVDYETVTDPTTGESFSKPKTYRGAVVDSTATPYHEKVVKAAKEGDFSSIGAIASGPMGEATYNAMYGKKKQDEEWARNINRIEANKEREANSENINEALAARNRGETSFSSVNKYRRDPSTIIPEREDSKIERLGSKLKPVLNFAKGGTIKGAGTGTSDSINAEVEEGSFVVPAKFADTAKMIKSALGMKKGKANLHQKKDAVPVKVSNGEELLTPEEKEKVKDKLGEETLEALAPEAEENADGYAKGTKEEGVEGDYPKELDNKFDSLRQKTEDDLRKAFPDKDIKVVYKGKERSLADQKKQFDKGSSTTKFGLHGIGAARDFNIIIDGRTLGNSKADHKIYQDYLWKNAEKDGLYHLNKDEFGKVDPYHIGLVEEKGDGTAFKKLVQTYPEITKTKQFQNSLKELQEIKAKNPKDTTYDAFLNSVKEVKPETKKTEVYNDNMSNIFSKVNAPKNQTNDKFSATEELNKISAKEKADVQNRKSAYEKSKAYKEKINEYMDKASDEKDKNAELTRINNGLAARKKEYDNILEKEKDPSKRGFGESDMRIAEQKKAVLKKLQELESAKSNASTVAVKETPKSNPFTGTTASAKKEVANNIFSKINQQPNLASTEIKDDVANITNPNKNAIDTVPITNENYVSPQDYALFSPKSNGNDPNLDKYNKDLAEANARTSPFSDSNLDKYNKDLAEANARTEPSNKPSFWDKVNGINTKGLGSTIANYGLAAYQIKKGKEGLKGDRPIDKIDPTFQSNVDKAQENAKFGFTPEQQFVLDQQNQNLLNADKFAARNFAGGSGGNAFNMERNASNNAFMRSLQNASANTELQQQKQGFAANLALQKANMSRNIFEDSLRAFEQKQQAAGNLMATGLSNIQDTNRFANYMRLRNQENEFNKKYNG